MQSNLNTSAFLQAALEIFAGFYGPAAGALAVTIEDAAGQAVRLTIPAAVPSGPLPALSPLESDIVRVLRAGPLKGRAIASRLGLSGDGSFRAILANLAARGVLANDGYGYRIVTAPERKDKTTGDEPAG